jgi:CheY-like chemotaxis protein
MPKKILIAESSRTEALRTRLILERAELEVVMAQNGKQVLEQAAEQQPELILLDTLLPGMSGFEVCGRLLLDPKTNHIPVVMMIPAETPVDMPSGSELDCFLPKPFEPSVLVQRVQGMLNGKPGSPSVPPANESVHRARNDFLANMSHELRTPLHEIFGMTELLLGTSLTEEQTGYLGTVKASSNALLSLVSDVIEFSEIEDGQLSLEEKPFSLTEPLERLTELMAPAASEKGLRFTTGIAPNVPHQVIGDANRVRQIISTLVANAIKFTTQGEVAIHLDAGALHAEQVELHFQVRDTGVGIPPDRQEIIFEPFQQADNSSTRHYGGIGIGLALAKQLVQKMGGRIWVESQDGTGSAFHFTVTLKCPPSQTVAATPTAAMDKVKPRALKILIAEDSPTNQLIAKASLSKAGHAVTLAVNGLEAVRAFEANRTAPSDQRFDLVLMDVSMPEMDGLEATRAIRGKENGSGEHLLIVAMTAFATREYQQKCMDSGMDAYTTKPVRIDELNKVLAPLLDRAPRVASVALAAPVDLKEALEIVGDDLDILRDAVAASLAEIPEQSTLLSQALTEKNAKGVEAKAHRLKGIMSNLGAAGARDIAQELETLGEKGQVDGGLEWFSKLSGEITRVKQFYGDSSWEQCARAIQEKGNG